MTMTCKNEDLTAVPPFPFVDLYCDSKRARDILIQAMKEQAEVRDSFVTERALGGHRSSCDG